MISAEGSEFLVRLRLQTAFFVKHILPHYQGAQVRKARIDGLQMSVCSWLMLQTSSNMDLNRQQSLFDALNKRAHRSSLTEY